MKINRLCGEMERAKGIEPSSVAWEATALPLSYTRRMSGKFMRRTGKKATGGTGPPVALPLSTRLGGAWTTEVDQKLPLKLANTVASRARFCSVVVLMPTLLFRPNRVMRAPITAVA